MRVQVEKSPKLLVLDKQTPIQAKVSDHNILVNDHILFFNMMMRCRWNSEKLRFNNGFGIVETRENYQARIRLIVRLLAEVITLNPQVDVIGLVEAPIRPRDIACFIDEFSKHSILERFKTSVSTERFSPMGVASFFDESTYQVTQIPRNDSAFFPSLKNRIQEFILTSKNDNKQFKLYNLHLPFDLAKSNDQSHLIRFAKTLFSSQHKRSVVVMGDFNIHPKIIVKHVGKISFYIPKSNSLLSKVDRSGKILGSARDTVDGVLQSSSLTTKGFTSYKDASLTMFNGSDPNKESILLHSVLSAKFGFFSWKNSKRTSIPSLSVGHEDCTQQKSRIDLTDF